MEAQTPPSEQDRRSGLPDRRQSPGRRSYDRRLDLVRAALWALSGSFIVLYAFFAAFGGIAPSEAVASSIIFAVLVVAWIVHLYLNVRRGRTAIRQYDRERRGF
jgi:uncharacterized membrane protein YtjA (UPF0391 family)